MSGLVGAVETALTGLNAFEEGIATVSQNVSNQTTAGYAVESVDITTVADLTPGDAGNGVQSQVTRAADGYAAGVLRTANSADQAATTTSSSFTAISNALTNNGDVQTVANQFFLDVGTLAANPTSAAQQQTVLSDAQTVTTSFQSAAGAIATTQSSAVTALTDNVGAANNLLGQLAAINKGLVTSPNDPSLIDQQEAALNTLSGLLSVSVIPTGTNGQVLLASGGTVLLNQAGAQTLTLNGGSSRVAPTITVGNGTSTVPLSSGSESGTIGGNIATWQAGVSALQGLNTLAAIFALEINTAQAQGLTSTGAQGQNLFTVPSPSVTPRSSNTGSASLTAQVSNPEALPTDGGPFKLVYNASSGWTAVDQATNTSYPVTASDGGASLSFAGLSLTVSGTPADGDSFTVDPAPGAAAAISVAASQGNQIASSDPYVATPGQLQPDGSILNSNGGTIVTGNTSVTATPSTGAAVIPSAYYGQSLQVTFTSPTAYNVETTADPTTTIASGALSGSNAAGAIAVGYPATGAAAGTYWQLPISGTPATGDVLTLTTGGSGSGSNATRMQSIWTASGSTESGPLQGAVVGLGTSLGADAQQATDLATGTAAQVTTATTNLQTIAGVSLDQQAVLLTQYQQAYQAAAQVIVSANAMFNSLLQAV